MKANKYSKINPKDTDEDVEKMVKTWDIVYCEGCGKKMSMEDRGVVLGDDGFLCRHCATEEEW